MSSMTNYLKNKILQDNLVSKEVFLALFNNKIEVKEKSYSRVKLDFLNAIEGQVTNKSDIYFNIASENWGRISHIGIYDKENNLLYYEKAEIEKEITPNDQYKIPSSYLIVRLD